ncbi:DNA-binding protein [Burkholderia ubonensis]|uniref:DUF746 domain-containing protein n=1 Tax=Burkholderia ubonensis TaxID=101571 RepID=UPI0007571A0F|nr:DUF746 domain-containing protein [Burkholderia ubonensis]KVO12613.1 DNA-binding protein [Burkholderia ubonensis]KVP31684.1 DNA-binding protein [Burkholderia ubonensis]KWB95242.1 DNA-binding protein [Burkholderia ubonensis]
MATKSRSHARLPAVGIDTGEDQELTTFLSAQIAALLSESHEPRPRCPRCGGGHISSAGFRTRPIGRLPMFECQTCQRYFSRTAGTPLGEKHLKKLDLFVSLLSQPISCTDAGERMGSLSNDISQRVVGWRVWLLQLDPSGQWERRIRLGGRPTELDPAPLTFDEIGAREDSALTARLTREFDDVNSLSQQPPACPDCGGRNTRFDECPNGAFPRFMCLHCRRRFTRRRGTPFLNTKMSSLERMRLFIRHLSLPLSVMQVADLVGSSHGMIHKWLRMFTTFADQLEPSGSLSARIQLGVQPTETTPCPFCGRPGSARQTERGNWTCVGCGRLFSMRRTVVERNGVLEIVDESMVGDDNPVSSPRTIARDDRHGSEYGKRS